MKIAFLLGHINANGGIARAVSIIAESLASDFNHQVYIINYSSLAANKTKDIKFNYDSIEIFDKQTSLRKGILYAYKKTRKYLKENNIDVLVSCGALYFILGALVTKGLKTRSIAWEHSNCQSNVGHVGKKYNRKIGARLSDFVVSLTKTDRQNYLKTIRKTNVEQIYNPIDPMLLKNFKPYSAENKKIVTVGNLNQFKNYKDLLRVANEIFKDKISEGWSWDVYGEGPERKELEELIEFYNLQGRVELKGRVDNIYDILSDYSLYVCTSRSEGLPMALIEAKAKHIPIVSFDIVTGPKEIITDGENGFLVELHNIEEMSKKILYLMKSSTQRTEFSQKTNIGMENFMLANCAAKWNALLNRVVK